MGVPGPLPHPLLAPALIAELTIDNGKLLVPTPII